MKNTKLKMSMDLAPLKKLAKQSPAKFKFAMKQGAIQFLKWANDGSANTSKKPPIKWGVLRGSSSAFVGGELVETFKPARVDGEPTPATNHSAPPLTATFVWNTDYAKKMHEHKGSWGQATVDDGNAGSKWLEEHLRDDRNDLMKVIGKEFSKRADL